MSEAQIEQLKGLAVHADQVPATLQLTSSVVDHDDLMTQAELDDLSEAAASAGFLGGVRQQYRGPSHSLTGVESQIWLFASAEGATEFARYVARHADDFFGEPTTVDAERVEGESVWLMEPPICDCAGARPVRAGIAVAGDTVHVLQITGPHADAAALHKLLSLPSR